MEPQPERNSILPVIAGKRLAICNIGKENIHTLMMWNILLHILSGQPKIHLMSVTYGTLTFRGNEQYPTNEIHNINEDALHAVRYIPG